MVPLKRGTGLGSPSGKLGENHGCAPGLQRSGKHTSRERRIALGAERLQLPWCRRNRGLLEWCGAGAPSQRCAAAAASQEAFVHCLLGPAWRAVLAGAPVFPAGTGSHHAHAYVRLP